MQQPGRLTVRKGAVIDSPTIVWRRLAETLHDPVEFIVFLPHCVRGGADRAAANAAAAAALSVGPEAVLVVATDSSITDTLDYFKPGTAVRSLDRLSPSPLTRDERRRLVELIIRAIRPSAVLNVNSLACWDALSLNGRTLSHLTRLYAFGFCRDYGEDSIPRGYADTHLRSALPWLERCYIDNRLFLDQLIADLMLPRSLEEKLRLLLQPVRNQAPLGGEYAEDMGEWPVVWGGRICRQKNPEMLLQIIDMLPERRFEIFGDGSGHEVTELRDQLGLRPNSVWRGSFSEPREMFSSRRSIFLFTSLWEGLPQVLLEVGMLGVPVIASAVGGVPEVINHETGWLIDDIENPAAYCEAIRNVTLPGEAATRAVGLSTYLRSGHSWDGFVAGLSHEGGILECLM